MYSGLFDSQADREMFILNLSKTNILLSAECKMTSILDEDELENQIITRAFNNYKDLDDYLSLMTLIKMSEYLIVKDLLDYKFNIELSENKIRSLMFENSDPLSFIYVVHQYLPNEVGETLLQLVESDTSVKTVANFEVLINLNSEENCELYLNEMIDLGLQPTVTIINTLISKDSKGRTPFYYSLLQENSLVPNRGTLKALTKGRNKNYPEIANEIFNYLITLNLDKAQFSTIYMSYLSLLTTYDLKVEGYKNFISQCKLRFKDEVGKIYHQKAIGMIIASSPNYFEASKWFVYAKEKFEDDIKDSIYKLYLYKFEDDLINDYIHKHASYLLPKFGKGTLNDEQRDSINISLLMMFKFLITLPTKFESCRLLLEEIKVNKFPPSLKVYSILFSKYQEENEIDYLVQSTIGLVELKPNFWTNKFSTMEEGHALNLFKALKKYDYKLNLFIYNAILNKCYNHENLIDVFQSMKRDGFVPDKITLTTLARRWDSLLGLITVIRECNTNRVALDNLLRSTILEQISKCKSELYPFFELNSKELYGELTPTLFNLLSEGLRKSEK